MKANKFIKKYGLDEAKVFVRSVIDHLSIGDDFNVQELKRLIESHDLVEVWGLDKSRDIVANAPSDYHFYSWKLGDSGVYDKTVNIGELRKAISDVESCQ